MTILSITITGESKIIQSLGRLPSAINQALYRKILTLALKMERNVKVGKLNGQVLNRISGALSRSIQNEVIRSDGSVTGKVFSSGDVKYAAIHEYGGTIKHPGGTAYLLKQGALAQFISNKAAAYYPYPRTKPHDIRMPERSFLRSTLTDMSAEISLGMKESVVQAIQKELG